MALYTREDATKTARVAKDNAEYTILVGVNKDFTKIQQYNYNQRAQNLWEGLEKLKETLDGRVVIITEKMIKEKFPFASTIKDLEVIFYQLVNYNIAELQKKHGTGEGTSPVNNTIYASDVGYNSKRMRFYVPVRETDKTIWLQRVGKKEVGGDQQNPLVIADTSVKDGEVIRRVKRSGGTSVKIDNYEYALLWDGNPIQEFSD